MTKIELTDNLQDVVVKMSEGNSGGLTAIMEILQKTEEIDPQNAMGGLAHILSLDTYGIYGSSIYVLWSDQCNRDIRELIMLLRATQLGFFSIDKLKAIANDQMGRYLLTQEEMDELDTLVTERLPEFKKREVEISK
ncbi:MAG: hypothetical protein DRO67_00295 [Candidatus Asgardarchaeum californiense]|nr:MAG: hypothetical protein DRO67_00295 [Candidatus Asgardarchaeum californiense]